MLRRLGANVAELSLGHCLLGHLGQPAPSPSLPPAVHQTGALLWERGWEGGPLPSPRRAPAPLLALSGLQRRGARLRGAWKRDRLFIQLSELAPAPPPGSGLSGVKTHSPVPTLGSDSSEQGFSVGGLGGEPPSGGLQRAPRPGPVEAGTQGPPSRSPELASPLPWVSVSGKAPVCRRQGAPALWVT